VSFGVKSARQYVSAEWPEPQEGMPQHVSAVWQESQEGGRPRVCVVEVKEGVELVLVAWRAGH
jgi:hypothetical protein